MIYNKGYDVWINLNYSGGIDIIYKGEVLPQYIGSKAHPSMKHPYPLVFVPDHGEACVHRLVAHCFDILHNSNEKIDHIDNNPFNSHPFNLRVVTSKENADYRKDQQPRSQENMRRWFNNWVDKTYTVYK